MYRMAAYCRLSRDDGENRVSESIENQLKLIREYIERSEDLKLEDVYIDDGFSGMSYHNRPGFQRMMKDIYRGKLQGVITKDISRLGREHIETGNYIERVFPALQIRYIAILDGLDSLSHCNEELAQFKTLFNDMYCRDISKKIKGALDIKKKQGEFMSGFAPYGYIKAPENRHRFLADQYASRIVKRIFSLYLAGYSKGGIAKILNEEHILAPSAYKRKALGLSYANGKEKTKDCGWGYSTVNTILKNPVYTGTMVQHKTEKISYKVDKYRRVPVEKQYIVEHMHEAVIDKDTFAQVQELMQKRTRTPRFTEGNRKANPYAGLLVCGDCGHNLLQMSGKGGYVCSSYHNKGNSLCRSHFIRKEFLDRLLRQEIKRQGNAVLGESGKKEKATEVTREMAVELIEKIVVNQDKSVDIVFAYRLPC